MGKVKEAPAEAWRLDDKGSWKDFDRLVYLLEDLVVLLVVWHDDEVEMCRGCWWSEDRCKAVEDGRSSDEIKPENLSLDMFKLRFITPSGVSRIERHD